MARIRSIKPGYKKRPIPEAARREVALANGGVPGERVAAHCYWCGAAGLIAWPKLYRGRPGAWVSFPGLHLDHVLAELHGGPSTVDNLVLSCRRCNLSRGAAA